MGFSLIMSTINTGVYGLFHNGNDHKYQPDNIPLLTQITYKRFDIKENCDAI